MSRTMLRALWILPLISCASDEKYVVVSVDVRPAVHDVTLLRVTLSNAGSTRAEDLPIAGAAFPATFSISPEGRTGDLGISIEALDKDGALVGVGSSQSTIEAAATAVMLDPTDFVVNTEYADDQQLSNYSSANGCQLAASPNGTWTAAYNTACTTPCNVFGRRFDVGARAVSSTVAAGTQGFPLSTKLTTRFYGSPAVAAGASSTLAVWNYQDPVVTTTYSIECRPLDANGAAPVSQVLIATDEGPDLAGMTALANGNFAIVWDGRQTNNIIRSAVLRPDCTTVPGTLAAVSPNVASVFPRRGHVAANATTILYAWLLDGGVRGRVANLNNAFAGLDTQLVTKPLMNDTVSGVRVVPLAGGFGVIVRWSTTGGGGRLELFRVSNAGAVMGPPVLVSDRSGMDYESGSPFGVATGADGSVLVVWHACMTAGDGNGCGVLGRLLRPTGDPAGPEFVIPTTLSNDQTLPSAVALPGGAFAVAWTDRSGAAPDTSGSAVRARIIYPGAAGAAQ
jgi:hypothetical protein